MKIYIKLSRITIYICISILLFAGMDGEHAKAQEDETLETDSIEILEQEETAMVEVERPSIVGISNEKILTWTKVNGGKEYNIYLNSNKVANIKMSEQETATESFSQLNTELQTEAFTELLVETKTKIHGKYPVISVEESDKYTTLKEMPNDAEENETEILSYDMSHLLIIPGSYDIYVTAVYENGKESDQSNIVSYIVPITEQSTTEQTTTSYGETEQLETEHPTSEQASTKIQKIIRRTFVVNFDYNGGTGTVPQIYVTNGKKYGKLPTTERKKHQFLGWYTKRTGGTKITGSTIVKLQDNQTLYAHWSKITVSKKIKVCGIKQRKGKILLKVAEVKLASGYVIYCSYNNKFINAKRINVLQKKNYTFIIKKVLLKAEPGWTYYYRIRPYVIDSTGRKVWGKYGRTYGILFRNK